MWCRVCNLAPDAMPFVSVVRFVKIFSIFVVSMGLTARRQTYLMKVFSHCPSKRMWKFSEVKDGRTALIPCIYAFGVLTSIVYHT